jgi:hypothetical protein
MRAQATITTAEVRRFNTPELTAFNGRSPSREISLIVWSVDLAGTI